MSRMKQEPRDSWWAETAALLGIGVTLSLIAYLLVEWTSR